MLPPSPWMEADVWVYDLVRSPERLPRPGMTYLMLLLSEDDGPGAGSALSVSFTCSNVKYLLKISLKLEELPERYSLTSCSSEAESTNLCWGERKVATAYCTRYSGPGSRQKAKYSWMCSDNSLAKPLAWFLESAMIGSRLAMTF